MIQQDSTKVTFNEVYHDLKGALEAAGDALKVGSEHVYVVLIKQQMVNSIVSLVIITALLIACFISFRVASNLNERDDLDDDVPVTFFIVSIVSGGFALIAILFQTNHIITGFINPEYGALMDIKDFIK